MKTQLVGDKKLIRRLNALVPKLKKRVLRSAVSAAGRPIRKTAKANVPVKFGNLKSAIDMRAKSYPDSVIAIVGARSGVIGTATNLWGKPLNARPVWYAHLAEKGSSPHAIRMGKGNKVVWNHPGTKATHFLSRAFESNKASASNIMQKKIAEGIERFA